MPAIQRRRRLMGEINVVPYIDVMLVLLIIFMVTAPLLTQGVQVELPDANAKPIDLWIATDAITSTSAGTRIVRSRRTRSRAGPPP